MDRINWDRWTETKMNWDQVLDLDTWTETKGSGSIDSVICPHCGQRFSPHATGGPGLHQCAGCGRPFMVAITETPVGVAYVTSEVRP